MTKKEELAKEWAEFNGEMEIVTLEESAVVCNWWLSKIEQIRKKEREGLVEAVNKLYYVNNDSRFKILAGSEQLLYGGIANKTLDEVLALIKQENDNRE